MAEINAELEDMMNVAADGNYNLKILNDAFEGRAHENEDIELVRVGGELKIKKRTKRPPRPETARVGGKNAASIFCGFDSTTSGIDKKDPRLQAIMEEVMQRTAADFSAIDSEVYRYDIERDEKSQPSDHDYENADANCMALVPVTTDSEFDVNRRKRNRELLKMQAKAASISNPDQAKVLYDIDGKEGGESSTFVTGGGIPGRKKKQKNKQQQRPAYDEEFKFYEYPEEELLDRVDKTEHEMQEMMRYLTSVEDMMVGDDLEQIRKMLDTTSTSVDHHSKAYNSLKLQVDNINKEATQALGRFSKTGDDVQKLLLETEQRKNATKVVIYEDDSEEEGEAQEGINIGKDKLNEESLQKQKEDIVDNLIGMNSNIRSFATDIDERLQRAYKAGNYSKKFGFDANLNSHNDVDELYEDSYDQQQKPSTNSAFDRVLNKDNLKLNRMQN